MSNYSKGRRFEYDVQRLFKDNGYTCVRTAGSHSPWDLMAYREGTDNSYECRIMVLVQCKVRRKK